MSTRAVLIGSVVLGAAALLARRHLVQPTVPGVTHLPGDTVLPTADLVATRSIVIAAPAADVWCWVAQVGQNRGGFYSHELLENLVGCRITNAEVVVPQWQRPQLGDEIRLAPSVGLTVVDVELGHHLVLLAGSQETCQAPGPMPYDFSWSFVVQPLGDHTRLVVRERYRYRARWAAAMVEPVSAVSAVMSDRMLRGIRRRAQDLHHAHAANRKNAA